MLLKFISVGLECVMAIISLRYEEGVDSVPLIDMNEPDCQLETIVLLAKKHGVPVIHDPTVARALATLDEGDPIPVQLYRAIAIILQTLQNLLEQR